MDILRVFAAVVGFAAFSLGGLMAFADDEGAWPLLVGGGIVIAGLVVASAIGWRRDPGPAGSVSTK